MATRDLMKIVLPEADVLDYGPLIPGLQLPDPDDRHVLAAAIAGGASVIVTWNLKDFPAAELGRHGLACQTPDAFLSRLYAVTPEAMIASLDRARRNLRKSTPTADAFLDAIERQGLVEIAQLVKERK